MATTFQVKRSSVAGKVPNTSTLSIGELGLNLTDQVLYSSNGTGIFQIGANLTNLTVGGIKANGSYGSSGQILTSNGTSSYWATSSSSSAGATGSNTEIQFNDSGSFGASAGLTFDSSANNLSVANTVSATHFDNVSDISLKENIYPIYPPHANKDVIHHLNPVSFVWRGTENKSYGLIAQEVEQILPTIVHSKQDGTKTVNYIEIIAFLIAAVKDLQHQIDDINRK